MRAMRVLVVGGDLTSSDAVVISVTNVTTTISHP